MVRAWHERGKASVNQTRPHFVNQMGKTHSNPWWHGMAGEQHALCVNRPLKGKLSQLELSTALEIPLQEYLIVMNIPCHRVTKL